MTKSEITLSKEIGERLRYARDCAGLSLSGLSDRTDGQLSNVRVSNLVQGIRRIGIAEARLLAAALGTVTPEFLLGLTDPWNLSPDEIELLTPYRTTDTGRRSEIRRRAESAAQRVAAEGRST